MTGHRDSQPSSWLDSWNNVTHPNVAKIRVLAILSSLTIYFPEPSRFLISARVRTLPLLVYGECENHYSHSIHPEPEKTILLSKRTCTELKRSRKAWSCRAPWYGE